MQCSGLLSMKEEGEEAHICIAPCYSLQLRIEKAKVWGPKRLANNGTKPQLNLQSLDFKSSAFCAQTRLILPPFSSPLFPSVSLPFSFPSLPFVFLIIFCFLHLILPKGWEAICLFVNVCVYCLHVYKCSTCMHQSPWTGVPAPCRSKNQTWAFCKSSKCS